MKIHIPNKLIDRFGLSLLPATFITDEFVQYDVTVCLWQYKILSHTVAPYFLLGMMFAHIDMHIHTCLLHTYARAYTTTNTCAMDLTCTRAHLPQEYSVSFAYVLLYTGATARAYASLLFNVHNPRF